MKHRNIFIGILFIIIGALYLGGSLNLIPYIRAWDIVIVGFAAYFIFKSLPKREFIVTCISLGVLVIVGKNYIDAPILEQLSMWTILVTSLIFGIGLQLIFKPRGIADNSWEYRYDCDDECKYQEEDVVLEGEFTDGYQDNSQYNNKRTKQSYREDQDKIFASNKLGSMTKYVRTQSFRGGLLQNSLGELVVDLTQAKLAEDGAILTVDCSLGETRILVPRQWAVRNEITATLAHVNDDRRGILDATIPQLLLRGNVSMGEIKILYV